MTVVGVTTVVQGLLHLLFDLAHEMAHGPVRSAETGSASGMDHAMTVSYSGRAMYMDHSMTGMSMAYSGTAATSHVLPMLSAALVALAAVDPRPYPAHRAPDVLVRDVRATDDFAGIALHSDLFALPNRRSSRRRAPGGEAREATRRQPPDSHTQHPWATQPYEWLDQPDQEGRAA